MAQKVPDGQQITFFPGELRNELRDSRVSRKETFVEAAEEQDVRESLRDGIQVEYGIAPQRTSSSAPGGEYPWRSSVTGEQEHRAAVGSCRDVRSDRRSHGVQACRRETLRLQVFCRVQRYPTGWARCSLQVNNPLICIPRFIRGRPSATPDPVRFPVRDSRIIALPQQAATRYTLTASMIVSDPGMGMSRSSCNPALANRER